jgi:hypothetical protein
VSEDRERREEQEFVSAFPDTDAQMSGFVEDDDSDEEQEDEEREERD